MQKNEFFGVVNVINMRDWALDCLKQNELIHNLKITDSRGPYNVYPLPKRKKRKRKTSSAQQKKKQKRIH